MTAPGFNLDDRPLAKRKLKALAEGAAPKAPPAAEAGARSPASMVDVGGKPVVRREAEAEGLLRLKPATVAAVRERRVKKGDPLAVAEVAAVQAVKATPTLLPLCHPIPITGVDVRLEAVDEGVRCRARVTADYKTGVEMEALTAVTVGLLCVWDMTKYLEKDERGQYPGTRLEGVRVVEKRKEGSY